MTSFSLAWLRTLGVAVLIGLAACSGHSDSTSQTATDTATTAPAADVTDAPADAVASAAPADASMTAAPPPPSATAAGTPAVVAAAPASAAPPAVPAFNDIADADAAEAIRELAAVGVFDGMSGAFHPNDPIARSLFVRWLVRANNAIFVNTPAKRIRSAETNTSDFVDVAPSNPDFRYIQGMVDAGYVVGIDAKHFAPARNLTREELIAILMSRDSNGAQMPKSRPPSSWNYDSGGATLPVDFTDRDKISKPYWPAFQVNDGYGNSYAEQEVKRIWGSGKFFKPQQLATRGDVAIALQVIDHASPPKLASPSP